MFALDATAPVHHRRAGSAAAPLDLTGNATIAQAADVVIGTPLALVGLLLLGIFARWLLHRTVDRLVKRAEDGVLPERMARRPAARVHGEPGSARELVARTRRVQRAKTMGSLLKSIITGVVVASSAR